MNKHQRTALDHYCRLATETMHPRFRRARGTGRGILGAARGAHAGGIEPARGDDVDGRGAVRGLADGIGIGLEREQRDRTAARAVDGDGAAHAWSKPKWIACSDGKSRAVEPGTFPLVNGATARVGRLRGYGNAIVAQVAARFIEAVMRVVLNRQAPA